MRRVKDLRREWTQSGVSEAIRLPRPQVQSGRTSGREEGKRYVRPVIDTKPSPGCSGTHAQLQLKSLTQSDRLRIRLLVQNGVGQVRRITSESLAISALLVGLPTARKTFPSFRKTHAQTSLGSLAWSQKRIVPKQMASGRSTERVTVISPSGRERKIATNATRFDRALRLLDLKGGTGRPSSSGGA